MLNATQKAILDRKNAVNRVGRQWWADTQADRARRAAGIVTPAPVVGVVQGALNRAAGRILAVKPRLSAEDLTTLRVRWAAARDAEKAGFHTLALSHLDDLKVLVEAAEAGREMVRVPF